MYIWSTIFNLEGMGRELQCNHDITKDQILLDLKPYFGLKIGKFVLKGQNFCAHTPTYGGDPFPLHGNPDSLW